MTPPRSGASCGGWSSPGSSTRLTDRGRRGLGGWWKTTAEDRFTKITDFVLNYRKFWEATHRLTLEQLSAIEEAIATTMVTAFNLDISALTLDMTSSAPPTSTRKRQGADCPTRQGQAETQ